MGNRANFVVVEKRDWRLYYAHCTGYRMLDALVGGPDFAVRYARAMEARWETDWVDPIWADGGAVIDLDQRRLLFFGDELMVEMAERRAMLKVLDVLWPAYEVCYAYDGTAELVDYVGANLPPIEWDRSPQIRLARKRNGLCHLVSVIDESGSLRFWPLWWRLSQAWHGPALLDKLPGAGLTRLKLNTIPEGGVHIDVGRKAVGEWHTFDSYGISRELPDLWPGWHTEAWGDGFEEQVSRCGSALRLPELDLGAAAASARAWIRKREPEAPYRAPGLPTGEWSRFTAACDALRADRAESA